MKILHLAEFSKGTCGVFNVVFNLAKEQAKRGHEVCIFSSDRIKGGGIDPYSETIEGVDIMRFPVKFALGENTLFWDFKKAFFLLQPDIIYCHCYRHPHCSKGLKYGKKIGARTFLVSHAPFVDKKLRGMKLHIATKIFDTLYGHQLNQYDKVLATTTWELPILKALGCKEENIVHVPNGVDERFLNAPMATGKGIIFFGRQHPIKDVPTLERACKRIGQTFDIIDNIPMNDIDEKIRRLSSYGIFVLPSKREAFPGSLIEALSLGMICIASKTQGAGMLIEHGKNGFLFEVGDDKKLAELIQQAQNMSPITESIIKQNARDSVKNLTWPKIVDRLEEITNDKKDETDEARKDHR